MKTKKFEIEITYGSEFQESWFDFELIIIKMMDYFNSRHKNNKLDIREIISD